MGCGVARIIGAVGIDNDQTGAAVSCRAEEKQTTQNTGGPSRHCVRSGIRPETGAASTRLSPWTVAQMDGDMTPPSGRRTRNPCRTQWRSDMGVEPTQDGITAPQTVLKTAVVTGPRAAPYGPSCHAAALRSRAAARRYSSSAVARRERTMNHAAATTPRRTTTPTATMVRPPAPDCSAAAALGRRFM